jgi:serine/threonine protein kinase
MRRARESPDAQAASEALVHTALAAGGGDNATALVIRVHTLGAERLDDALRRAEALPVPGALKVGDLLDGLQVTALVADNGVHRLLQMRDLATQTLAALKTLSLGRAADAEERAMLAHEAWLGSRVAGAPGFVPLREVTAPTRFYTLYDWVPGRTLEQLLESRRPFGVGEIVDAALQVTRALGRLHRQGVIHRDIKPANLHRGDDGRWRIIDLGAALSGREPEAQRSLRAGTPSYINPEQWAEPPRPPDAGSDLYALGVTLYRWLAGSLPYGEIEPYQLQRYRRDPPPLSRRRPDVPMWLDHVVRKAVARDARARFETAEELLLALERGASRPLPPPAATPLSGRDPAALWKIGFVISLLLNALLIVWLLWLPR